MPGRAIYKASIQVDGTTVPIRFYSAIRRRRVPFRLLHETDEQPLQQKLFCSKEDRPVEPEEQARGYEVARGQYVVLDPEELRALAPSSNRTIDVLHFVDEVEIDRCLLDRPYYLGPDGQDQDYALLTRALSDSGRVAICRWIMRRRHYLGMLRPLNGVLLMVTLRFAHQLRSTERLGIERRQVSQKELQTATTLIEELSEPFDPADYQDEYEQQLLRFIEQKARGQKPKMRRVRRKKPTTPEKLQATLERSLKRASGG